MVVAAAPRAALRRRTARAISRGDRGSRAGRGSVGVSGRPLRVLVAGREGQLARALAPAFAGAGWDVAAWGRPALDLAGPADAIADAVRANAPDLVVNAAAYTAVDRAETEPAAAMAVNRDGAAALAA